jgi:hypothetical protein
MDSNTLQEKRNELESEVEKIRAQTRIEEENLQREAAQLRKLGYRLRSQSMSMYPPKPEFSPFDRNKSTSVSFDHFLDTMLPPNLVNNRPNSSNRRRTPQITSRKDGSRNRFTTSIHIASSKDLTFSPSTRQVSNEPKQTQQNHIEVQNKETPSNSNDSSHFTQTNQAMNSVPKVNQKATEEIPSFVFHRRNKSESYVLPALHFNDLKEDSPPQPEEPVEEAKRIKELREYLLQDSPPPSPKGTLSRPKKVVNQRVEKKRAQTQRIKKKSNLRASLGFEEDKSEEENSGYLAALRELIQNSKISLKTSKE